MRISHFLITGAIWLFGLNACTSVKRFKSAEFKGTDSSLVEVDLFHTRLSPGPVALEESRDIFQAAKLSTVKSDTLSPL